MTVRNEPSEIKFYGNFTSKIYFSVELSLRGFASRMPNRMYFLGGIVAHRKNTAFNSYSGQRMWDIYYEFIYGTRSIHSVNHHI